MRPYMARPRRSAAPARTKYDHGEDAQSPRSSRRPGWSPPAATPKASTASSIRRSITPPPCSIPTAEDQVAHRARYQYGRRGTPTTEALEERAARARGRGLRRRRADAVGPVGHLHRADGGRRRRRPHPGHRQRLPADPRFCDGLFKRMGVETTYYDPLIGAGIAKLIKPNTRGGVRRGARLAELRDAGHSRPSPRSRTTRARWC